MNRRILIGIIVAAGVLLLGTLVLVVVMWLQQPEPIATNNENANTVVNAANTNTTTTTTTSTATDTTTDTTSATTVVLDDEATLRRVINNFTERFGSYSTDTNYENIALSRSLMTDTMAAAADKIVSNNTQKNNDFHSVESRVMTTVLTDYVTGATGATAEVSVRQTIIAGQADPTYSNQTARLTLIKVNDTWKVDSFRWL